MLVVNLWIGLQLRFQLPTPGCEAIEKRQDDDEEQIQCVTRMLNRILVKPR